MATLMFMKHVLYTHTVVRTFVGELHRVLMLFLNSRLRPHLRRLFPSPAGRRLIAHSMLLLGLVMQAVLLWLLSALVSISIDVMHLWAQLASYHYAITS